MKLAVEIDHSKAGQTVSSEISRGFIEGIIFPTLARAEQLVKEGIILTAGPVAGRAALRFIAEVESAQKIDQIATSIPLWTIPIHA